MPNPLNPVKSYLTKDRKIGEFLIVDADKNAREEGRIDCNTDCVYGNDIDKYHDSAFSSAGLNPKFYGGNLWPQGMPPNPVPIDRRNPIRPPGYFIGP